MSCQDCVETETWTDAMEKRFKEEIARLRAALRCYEGDDAEGEIAREALKGERTLY